MTECLGRNPRTGHCERIHAKMQSVCATRDVQANHEVV